MGKASGTSGRAGKGSHNTLKVQPAYDATAARAQVLDSIKALGYSTTGRDLDTINIRASKIFTNTSDKEIDEAEAKRLHLIEAMKQKAGYQYSYEYVDGEGKQQSVDTSQLIATQYYVTAAGVARGANYAPGSTGGSNGLPSGFRVKGDSKVYLIDGHHRAACNILRGDKKMAMNIIEVSRADFDKYYK